MDMVEYNYPIDSLLATTMEHYIPMMYDWLFGHSCVPLSRLSRVKRNRYYFGTGYLSHRPIVTLRQKVRSAVTKVKALRIVDSREWHQSEDCY